MADELMPKGEAAGQAPESAPQSPTASPARRKFDPQMAKLALLYLAICIGIPILSITAFHLPTIMKQLALQTELPFEGVQALSVLLATFVVSRVARRPMGDFGLPGRQAFGLRFWEGAVWGFAMLSTVVLVLHFLGDFQITGVALSRNKALIYALGWGAGFLFVGIYEECFFRGFFLFALARRFTFWPAALILSALFAAAHLANSGENLFGILQVFVVGMLFCFTIRRTGSLWFAIGLHASWDWAQTFFYGTPDSGLLGVGHFLNSTAAGPKWLSGGSAGPEGSVLALFVLLLSAALINLRFPKPIYPDRPA